MKKFLKIKKIRLQVKKRSLRLFAIFGGLTFLFLVSLLIKFNQFSYTAQKSIYAADNCCNDPGWKGHACQGSEWDEGWNACKNHQCSACAEDKKDVHVVKCPAQNGCPEAEYNEQCHVDKGNGKCDRYYCNANKQWQSLGPGTCEHGNGAVGPCKIQVSCGCGKKVTVKGQASQGVCHVSDGDKNSACNSACKPVSTPTLTNVTNTPTEDESACFASCIESMSSSECKLACKNGGDVSQYLKKCPSKASDDWVRVPESSSCREPFTGSSYLCLVDDKTIMKICEKKKTCKADAFYGSRNLAKERCGEDNVKECKTGEHEGLYYCTNGVTYTVPELPVCPSNAKDTPNACEFPSQAKLCREGEQTKYVCDDGYRYQKCAFGAVSEQTADRKEQSGDYTCSPCWDGSAIKYNCTKSVVEPPPQEGVSPIASPPPTSTPVITATPQLKNGRLCSELKSPYAYGNVCNNSKKYEIIGDLTCKERETDPFNFKVCMEKAYKNDCKSLAADYSGGYKIITTGETCPYNVKESVKCTSNGVPSVLCKLVPRCEDLNRNPNWLIRTGTCDSGYEKISECKYNGVNETLVVCRFKNQNTCNSVLEKAHGEIKEIRPYSSLGNSCEYSVVKGDYIYEMHLFETCKQDKDAPGVVCVNKNKVLNKTCADLKLVVPSGTLTVETTEECDTSKGYVFEGKCLNDRNKLVNLCKKVQENKGCSQHINEVVEGAKEGWHKSLFEGAYNCPYGFRITNICKDTSTGISKYFFYCSIDSNVIQVPATSSGQTFIGTPPTSMLISVHAQPSYFTYTQDGLLIPQETGTYKFRYQGKEYQVRLYKEAKNRIYIDANNNGQKDANERFLDEVTKVTQLKISPEILEYSYTLKPGYNFVHFPFIFREKTLQQASGLLKHLQLNGRVSLVSYYDGIWHTVDMFGQVGENSSGYMQDSDFAIIPGRGYVIRNIGNTDILTTFEGYPVDQVVPINFMRGWNLVGFYNPNKTYTASSLIKSINKDGKITAVNVTRWDSGKYDGMQQENNKKYGFDFPIYWDIGYFVNIKSLNGDKKVVQWQDD